MVAYNFQQDFGPDILAGIKRSTIRPNGKRCHARPGEMLQLYTGMRRPECTRLMLVPCLTAGPIEIHAHHVIANGRFQSDPEYYRTLARIEGFDSFGNLQAWFDRRYGLPAQNLTQITWDFHLATDIAALAGVSGVTA